MPPILLCGPTMSEVDVGGMTVELEPSQQNSVTFDCCVTDGSREAVCMKQRCSIESLHAEKIAPIDIYHRLLNVYGDQTMDVNTVRQWVVHFSIGSSDSGSPLLLQIVMSVACRLLFIAGENAELMVVSMLKTSVL